MTFIKIIHACSFVRSAPIFHSVEDTAMRGRLLICPLCCIWSRSIYIYIYTQKKSSFCFVTFHIQFYFSISPNAIQAIMQTENKEHTDERYDSLKRYHTPKDLIIPSLPEAPILRPAASPASDMPPLELHQPPSNFVEHLIQVVKINLPFS